jgi:uncharacterized protein (DUF885 family)
VVTRREWLVSCAAATALAQEGADSTFIQLANDYIARLFELEPEMATATGEHRYDGRLADRSPEGLRRRIAFEREFEQKLQSLRPESMSGANRIDYQILSSTIQSSLWNLTEFRPFEWNPMAYNPGGSIYLLLEREFAPLSARLESIRQRLEAVPAALEVGRENLRSATRIHTETAIGQIGGTIGLIKNVVGKHPEVADAQGKAVRALEAWRQWLSSDLLPRAKRDFRIGPDLYRAKLRLALHSDLSPEEIYRRAQKDLETTKQMMYRIAAGQVTKAAPAPSDVVRAYLDKLSDQRPDAATVVEQARRELADATAFVRKHKLVSVYDTPLKIVEMPEFQRGVAVASCGSPGPLERNGITFFNISPPPSNWTPAQVESYFREYNDYMLKNLTVHEAMPGHYLQRAHANRFEAPTLVRAIFSSGTFTEGWAVYAEKIMAERGYGGPGVQMQQLKMRLRTIINAILDQGVHMRGMTEDQAMSLMMNEGFQEKSEAAGKWRRACLTSAQLSMYYVGTTEIDEIRADYIRANGPIRDVKAFHDRMLSFGSPAPRFVRELMEVPRSGSPVQA